MVATELLTEDPAEGTNFVHSIHDHGYAFP
jgi:hypothetical protein